MKKILSFFFIFSLIFIFTGCNNNQTASGKNLLSVYNVDSKSIEKIDMEEYIEGVVAGEIYNDWNIEAIKAQAVLARTFAVHFMNNNKSKYNGADISTDINEAQAYNKSLINDKIRQAVRETSGIVITYQNKTIYPYFHSNSGGITALASTGLSVNNLGYIKSVSSPETSFNSKNYSWTTTLSKSDVLSAMKKINLSLTNVSSIQKGEESNNRLLTIIVGGKKVSANLFRKAVGTTIIKSTYITSIKYNGNQFVFSGKGYGHGVGLSQWGAQIMANSGKTYKEIISYYFNDIKFTNINNT